MFSARHLVSDMQVPDEDDSFAAQPPPHDQSEQQDRERANLDARFASKQQNRERTMLDQSGHQQDDETAFGIRH